MPCAFLRSAVMAAQGTADLTADLTANLVSWVFCNMCRVLLVAIAQVIAPGSLQTKPFGTSISIDVGSPVTLGCSSRRWILCVELVCFGAGLARGVRIFPFFTPLSSYHLL